MIRALHNGAMNRVLLILFMLTSVAVAQSDPDRQWVSRAIEQRGEDYREMSRKIWEWAELGYQERRSSELVQKELRRAGFEVRAGVAEIPTAFVASYGEGKPVIGILAEYDALPGLSQAAAPIRKERVSGGAGHGCGHHLFAAASTAAGVALKDWLVETGRGGTVRVYGTPAEEGGSGKVYMARAGLFEDVDIVLHWHPSDRNNAMWSDSLANRSAKFRFRGRAAHASASPHRGRSALDGVEAMNDMANMLREHLPQGTRLHYVITRGGQAPNVVPESAEVFYYLRHPKAEMVEQLWPRLEDCAQGAALGTGTEVEVEIIHGNLSLLPNKRLAQVVHENLEQVGGVDYNDEEREFAEELRQSIPDLKVGTELAGRVRPLRYRLGKGSTDVGDISWLVPTGGVRTATWVPGTSGHTWQAVAAGGTSIGHKGMMVAAKVLARTGVDLFKHPGLVEEAWHEFREQRGRDYRYKPLLGERKPPLDYRE